MLRKIPFPSLCSFFIHRRRLNRALEEAEKYKTALKKAKSESKVSQLFTVLFNHGSIILFRGQIVDLARLDI